MSQGTQRTKERDQVFAVRPPWQKNAAIHETFIDFAGPAEIEKIKVSVWDLRDGRMGHPAYGLKVVVGEEVTRNRGQNQKHPEQQNQNPRPRMREPASDRVQTLREPLG